MVHGFGQGNRKRREQQMSALLRGYNPKRGGGVTRGNASSALPWNEARFYDNKGLKRERKWLFQTFCAVVALFFTYLVVQSHSPAMQPVERFVVQTMTKDFDFTVVSKWYRYYVGGTPSILPAFLSQTDSNTNAKQSWSVPATGKVIVPFDERKKGIVIRTVLQAPVKASGEGLVIFSGYKAGLGNTVVIRHAGGHETWYGWLQKLDVKEKEWIQKGQSLGCVGQTQGQPLLYFAIKKDQNFVNPSDVMPLE